MKLESQLFMGRGKTHTLSLLVALVSCYLWIGEGVFRVQAQLPGSRDTLFRTIPGSDIYPTSLVIAPDGTLFAGGSFTNYGGAGLGGVARLLSNGELDPEFRPVDFRDVLEAVVRSNVVVSLGQTNRGKVTGLALYPNGLVAVVGDFNEVNGEKSFRFAVLNRFGGMVEGFDTNWNGLEARGAASTFSGRVFIYGAGRLEYNDTNRLSGRIPLVEAGTGGFVPPTFLELGYQVAFVNHVLSGPTNTLYAFLSVVRTNNAGGFELLRFSESGRLDPSFGDGGRIEISDIREPLARVSPQGELYISGAFQYGGQFIRGPLSRLRLNGEIDTTFAPAIASFAQPYLGVEPDGNLSMLNAGGVEFMVRLRPDGTRDLTYQDPVQSPSPATIVTDTMRVGPDGSAYLMGTTLTIEGAQFDFRHGVVKVHGGRVRLGYSVVNGRPQFTWPSGFRLQRSSVLGGAWEEVVGAASPWTPDITGTSGFFRLNSP